MAKRIRIQIGDEEVLARPLTLGMLRDFDGTLKTINSRAHELSTGAATEIPMDVLQMEAEIIRAAVRLVDPKFDTPKAKGPKMDDMCLSDLNEAFLKVLTGSGLEEVPAGE